MNEAQSNQTGLSDTFSSQPAPQTNPFTADLKGEFTSNFGTNTNAVSQIFKEGGFVSQNRTKYLIIGGAVIVVLAVLFFFLTDSSSTSDEEFAAGEEAGEEATAGEEESTEETAATEEEGEAATEEEATEEASTTEATDEGKTAATSASSSSVPDSVPSSVGSGTSFGSGPVTLAEPTDGSSLNYDESQGPAVFSWTGGGGHIVFSRNQSMNPPALRIRVNGNSYSFHHPWPGNWFWRVENASGQTEVRSFKVNPPQRRAHAFQQPASGGAIAGNGGTVSWQGDGKVAYYRVEVSTGGWANPQHRFASSGNSVQLNGVAPGQYQMRLGAFSEVSGRWEYTSPIAVTVQ